MMKIAFSDITGRIIHAIDALPDDFVNGQFGITNRRTWRWIATHGCQLSEVGIFRMIDGIWQELMYCPFRPGREFVTIFPGDEVRFNPGEINISVT